jgi:hypothetical protein
MRTHARLCDTVATSLPVPAPSIAAGHATQATSAAVAQGHALVATVAAELATRANRLALQLCARTENGHLAGTPTQVALATAMAVSKHI